MKKSFILILLILGSLNFFGQSKKVLRYQLEKQTTVNSTLTTENQSLSSEIKLLKSEIEKLKDDNRRLQIAVESNRPSNSVIPKSENAPASDEPKTDKTQCKATTASGAQCKRMAEPSSDYCWQHKNSREVKSTTKTPGSKSGSYTGSKTIHTGSRGGQYYINKNGNKTYIKKK